MPPRAGEPGAGERPVPGTTTLRLGTRGSTLALAQSRAVAEALEASGAVRVEVEVIRTTGDRDRERSLPAIGGKGVFTRELDLALLGGEIDFAVHSLKDLPTATEPGLRLACVPEREDPRDVLVGPGVAPLSLASLPPGSIVGTSSLRRKAFTLAFRPDLSVRDVRGNLDTRLDKLDAGGYDALILAAAGLRRLGRGDRIGEWLERTAWLPAPGQGALGIVCREGDERTKSLLGRLAHRPSESAVRAERALLAALEGGCQVPIGALGLPYEGGLRLWGIVASLDGRRLVRGDLTEHAARPERLGRQLADLLLSRGAGDLLEEADAVPTEPHPRA